MTKNLTVVIPTYNMEKYLDKCISSLVALDKKLLSSLEILVVNDGSKDNSSIIAHKYEVEFPESVRVIDKENGNYGSCVNRGVKEAQGKYIKILDADDSFETNNFSEFLKLLSCIEVDMVISDYITVDENDKLKNRYSFDFPKNSVFEISAYFDILNSAEMHAVTYKLDNLKKLNYRQTEGVSYTDFEWMFSPMSTVKSAFYFPNVVYKYLVGRAGQTVDIKVYHKKWRDRVVGLWPTIKFYQKYISSDYETPVKDFMEARLIGRIHGLYLSFLIVNRDKEEGIAFDRELLSRSSALYKKSENLIINNYFKNYLFVKRWRETSKLPAKIITTLYLSMRAFREILNKVSR